jgi:hypothetical protein
MYKFFFIITFIFIQGCSNSGVEYFCESYHTMRGGRDITYSQQVIKLLPDEICFNWRNGSPLTCIKKGSITTEPWEIQAHGASQSRHSFDALFNGDLVTINVYELVEPKNPSDIQIVNIGNELRFYYKSLPLDLGLPLKHDTLSNRKTFSLYAINNVEYWKGRMISSFKMSNETVPRDVVTYSVGGDAYKTWYAKANNEISSIYTFDAKNLSLIWDPRDTDDHPPHRYSCEVWKKQAWWQF